MSASNEASEPTNNEPTNNEPTNDNDDVMEIDEDHVAVATGPPMVLSPNLQFPVGSRVRIQGLQHQQKLNSHLAIVEEYLWEQGRYKILPLGRQAKLLTKSKFVSVKANHLQKLVDPSSFFARLTDRTGATLRAAFVCQVELDQQQKLCVKLLYDDSDSLVLDPKTREELNRMSCHDDPNVFEILNAPIDFEEYLSEDQFLDGDEILILYPKPIIDDLYEAMLDYELLEELDLTANVGLHGSINLCRLRFLYKLPGLKDPPNYEQEVEEPAVSAESDSTNKRQKALNDPPEQDDPKEGATSSVQENVSCTGSCTKKRQLDKYNILYKNVDLLSLCKTLMCMNDRWVLQADMFEKADIQS
jgi:hypothetical protein